MMGHMGEEIELAAKASAEALTALTEASGALGPPREFWGAITAGMHYRFYPKIVSQAIAAAEKIKKSGLPPKPTVRSQTGCSRQS
jgi:hypothetical protein